MVKDETCLCHVHRGHRVMFSMAMAISAFILSLCFTYVYTIAVAVGSVVHYACGEFFYLHCLSYDVLVGPMARLGSPRSML